MGGGVSSTGSSSGTGAMGGMGGMGGIGGSSSTSSSGIGGGVITFCGDGAIAMGEACDDGDMQSGDGCSSMCQIESGYACMGMPSVCTDIDECAMNNGGCSANAICTNTIGSRMCACNMGYTGDGVTCTDVNECAMNNGGCDINAICTNTPGSRTCMCKSGYSGDGFTCTPVNGCAMNNGGCSVNATCTFANNMVSCACNMGYTGNGITCMDINECMTNNGGCSANATCTNTMGSRTCACNMGYTGNGITCTDINECAMNNGGCSANATCTNTMGSRTCACNMGYMGDGITCTDVNECLVNNGGCAANESCTNTAGSFMCVPGCATDPTGISNAFLTIGPSEAMAAMCNAQVLVGNQSLNRLEVRSSTGAVLSSYNLPDKPHDIAYDVATNTAYATLFNTMAMTTDLVRVNLTTGTVTSIPIGGLGLRVALGNNGLVFVTMSDGLTFPNRPIALVNGTNATLIKTFLVPYGGSLIAFDRNSNLMYLADAGASPSKLERYGFDPMGQTLMLAQSRANTGNIGVDLAISPDGTRVALSCSQGNQNMPANDFKLHDIHATDLNMTYGIFNTGLYPTAAVFSPDNTKLMATNGSTMRRFSVATHAVLSEIVLQPCTNGEVRRIAVSPGGTFTYVLTRCGAPATSGIVARFYYP